MKVPLEFLTKFDEDNLRKLNQLLLKIESAINTIEFGDGTTSENILCVFVHVLTPEFSSSFSAVHTLGRVPVGVIPIMIDTNSGVDEYCNFSTTPGSAHTSTTIYLNASATGTSATFLII